MRKTLTLISVALLLLGGSATAAIPQTRAQQEIQKLSVREPLRSSSWGVLAVTVKGDTLVNINARQKMVPASNVKLLTTGLALRNLGPDFRFETKIAYSGNIKEDGTLVGDLFIIGGGDPTTGSASDSAEKIAETFGRWTELVREAGIRKVDGRIIGDPRFFEDPSPENQSWSLDDVGTYYGAGPQGLNFFQNAQNFYITPGSVVGARPYIRPRYPETPWMEVSNLAMTGREKTSNEIYCVNTSFGPYAEVVGSFPIDRKGYTLESSNRFGPYTCAYYFCKHLSTNGIEVTQGFGDVDPRGHFRTDLKCFDSGFAAPAQKSLKVIGSTWSPRLSDIVSDTNLQSNNFYAETLLHMLGKSIKGKSDYDSCQKTAEELFRKMGLSYANSCQIFDGSGLSRKNYISPAFFVAFMRIMARSDVYQPYFDSLPIPGGKGTLDNRFRNAPDAFKKRIHAKTGSMNGVRSLSGYILAQDGNPDNTIVFSLIFNNFTANTTIMSNILENVVSAIAAEN